jgi:murein DD-endopeptidase MepM/ murein hydrolase activator NlpD
MPRRVRFAFLSFVLFWIVPPGLRADPAELVLPTENRHLFSGEPERFYMYTDRFFEGEASKPWQGGAYGFTRTPQRIQGEVVMTKFHEGIDIAPVKRDRAGNPLDLIFSIADGTVVYISPVAGRSNYGKYLVVEHPWQGSRIYSLYAHLAEITCQPGDPVKAGSVLGRMGYTGAGINRTRAHLHLELGLLLSSRYEDWHARHFGSLNHHGLFNGMNLAGADVARFYLERQDNPALSFAAFIAATPAHFKVAVPGRADFEFLERHPWMLEGERPAGTPPSWEITFSATGLPIAISAGQQSVREPQVVAVKPMEIPHRHLTRGLITGTGNQASLTTGGRQLLSLITGDFPAANR